MKKILITGAAGFIGSNFTYYCQKENFQQILLLDALTYAGNFSSLHKILENKNHSFIKGNIGDKTLVHKILENHQPDTIVNFAAETHVDRSIHDPEAFIQSNVVGTLHLLEEAKSYWLDLPAARQKQFRFLHISTDEVFGSLGPNDPPFTELTPYKPNNPYSASKAAADHLVKAYFHTYGLPTLINNCSNNFGPFQFPEKLIPLTISNALEGKDIPIYGDGSNIRDWLFVEDHCAAIIKILEKGKIGESYNIGSRNEKTNLELIHLICTILDKKLPHSKYTPHASLIKFIKDRPGHDRRYAIDPTKLEQQVGWRSEKNFQLNIEKTIDWYLSHQAWLQELKTDSYDQWIKQNYSPK